MSEFNRERLTEIRTIRNITMEQLANSLGKTKQMISKYEVGKSLPSDDTVQEIADALSISKDYFYKESTLLSDGSSTLFLRAPFTIPKKSREKCRILSRWGYEIVREHNDAINPFNSINIDNDLSIPEKAMELRKQWNLGIKPISNMVQLLESKGFNIFTIDLQQVKTDAYSQIINGFPIIVLNKQIGTAVRQRFSLAHELGHMILHRELDDWEFDLRNKEIENEAHQFAEYFLLPTEGFVNTFVSPDFEHLIMLKKEWLVSLSAIIIHCERTGLIDTNKKELLLKQISFRGWKKFEPLDSSIEYEKPIAMGEKMINLSKNQYKFSVFIRKLRLPLNDIEALCSLPINSLASRVYDGDDNNS